VTSAVICLKNRFGFVGVGGFSGRHVWFDALDAEATFVAFEERFTAVSWKRKRSAARHAGLAPPCGSNYCVPMLILIKFPDKPTEDRAIGMLIPKFPGKSWKTGETAVPTEALAFLAEKGVQFSVIGPAPYELLTTVRDTGSVAV
jgi:hypothetical protein